jgi:hypothetical protein
MCVLVNRAGTLGRTPIKDGPDREKAARDREERPGLFRRKHFIPHHANL